MAKYLLKSCCCGCGSLRTGTIFSGVVAIILSIVGIILAVLSILKELRVTFKTILFDFLNPDVVHAIVIFNLIMTIILTTIMLVGVVKRKWFLMAPWVILGGLLAIGLLVSIIINSVTFYNDGDNLWGTLWLVLGLISLVIYCYMWYVCTSFFVNLMEEAKRGSYSKDPFRRQPS